MKLIGSTTSSFVRKVRIVLAEKKMDYEFEVDSPWTPETKVPSLNPLGKIPVLVLDDNTTLIDSRVIVEYLDNVAPNNKLMPAPNRERTEVKLWEAIADGICDAAALVFLEKKRAAKLQDKTWISRQEGKMVQGLAYLSAQLAEKPWCIGGTSFSLADISVTCTLGYLLLRFPEMTWQEDHPNLLRLYEKMMKRQSFIDTIPVIV